jgi:hypothetical protein
MFADFCGVKLFVTAPPLSRFGTDLWDGYFSMITGLKAIGQLGLPPPKSTITCVSGFIWLANHDLQPATDSIDVPHVGRPLLPTMKFDPSLGAVQTPEAIISVGKSVNNIQLASKVIVFESR